MRLFHKQTFSEYIDELMLGFKALPYQICQSEPYRDGRSTWAMLNMNNRQILVSDLEEINSLVDSSRTYKNVTTDLPYLQVPVERINFAWTHGAVSGPPLSFMEYWPLTSGGYARMEPLIVHFTTVHGYGPVEGDASGDLSYAQDGSMSSASVVFWHDGRSFSYSFGMLGRSFVIRQIKFLAGNGKNVVAYKSDYDFADLNIKK